jgi:hypothetical protein
MEAVLNVQPREARGRSLAEVGEGRWGSTQLRDLVERALAQTHDGDGPPLRASIGDGAGALHVYARTIDAAGDGDRLVLLGVEQVEAVRA